MVLSFYSCTSQEKHSQNRFLGEITPGDSAVLFAPDKLNHPEGYHSALIISKDLKEVYFSPMTRNGEIQKMINFSKSTVSEKVSFPELSDADDPFLSPDNKRLYFLSFQPLKSDAVERERIWYAEIKDGKLLKPTVVDKTVHKHPTHWQFSVAANYNLYFTSEIKGDENQDIYLSRYSGGKYQEPEKLPKEINTEYRELCPYISPAEDYIIFTRIGKGTQKADLYISYKKNETWTKAERLTNSINSKENDLCPVVLPEGNYLFFISTRKGVSKIYWVNTGFIKNRFLQKE
jgi:Tol biopolymer transport system component